MGSGHAAVDARDPGFDATDIFRFDGMCGGEAGLGFWGEALVEDVGDDDLAFFGFVHETGCNVDAISDEALVGAAEGA